MNNMMNPSVMNNYSGSPNILRDDNFVRKSTERANPPLFLYANYVPILGPTKMPFSNGLNKVIPPMTARQPTDIPTGKMTCGEWLHAIYLQCLAWAPSEET